MDVVRMGVIGLGNMGTAHAQSIDSGEISGMALSAVADVNPARLAWAEQNLPGAARFESAAVLMGSGLCDAVLIATPHYDHPPLAIAALRSGLHVLCEKPAGVYSLAVREMNAESDKHPDLRFGMMFNQRTNCVFREVKRLLSAGQLGALKRVNWIVTDWYRTQYYYDSGAWRATWAGEGGGVLLNQCPHNLDLLQWLCGMPRAVTAFMSEGKWHDIEVEDDVTAYLEYPGGATGVFVTSTGDAPGTNRLEISGSLGKLVCENGQIALHQLAQDERAFCASSQEGFAQPACAVVSVQTDGANPQHAGVLRAFAGSILGSGELVADGREGIHGLTLSNAMHLSAWLGRRIEIPFDEQLFLEELNKRRAVSRHKAVASVVMDTSGSYGTK